MSIEFDFSDVTALAADLSHAARVAPENVGKAVAVTAKKVRDGWREPLSGSESLPGGAAAVTYDLKGSSALTGSAISAEIGPELKGQGPLVGMLEYGTPTTGPRGYGAEALRKNQEDFERGILRAVEDAL